MSRFLLSALVLAGFAAQPLMAGPPTPSSTLADANIVLEELAGIPLKGIPPALLADAQGVAIIPRVIKAGFILAGRGGHGVVLAKDKEGKWSVPTFIHLGGGSIGLQAGVESTDVVLVFRTRKSLDSVMEGKDKLTLGGDASIAAGPIGREAAAGTDLKLEAEIVSYSRSRGLFAGVSLNGAVIGNDRDGNAWFAKHASREDLKNAGALLTRLTQMSATTPTAKLILPPTSPPPLPPVTGPSPLPPPPLPPLPGQP
ncbi:lipid-binding SYLF domain-containing protein [Zavarzinella formosa]|uniref:lipid-binding SYLF domain-containing protein n=1 Tax=Zavarzinella formosa TaxID=360055 RepID=UPI0002F88B68|nr:lipid-binding SYLF domain-containing protein [Zavarzinella formosa]